MNQASLKLTFLESLGESIRFDEPRCRLVSLRADTRVPVGGQLVSGFVGVGIHYTPTYQLTGCRLIESEFGKD
jgi:hypothetical protein